MALQVDHVEGQVSDGDGVAVGQDPVRADRQRVGVESVGRGGDAGGLDNLLQCEPVVAVLVAGDDQGQFGGVSFDQVEQHGCVIGRIDE